MPSDIGEASVDHDGLATYIGVLRPGQPSDKGGNFLRLAGPENTYISGQSIVIDGGFTNV
jgi:NAD(P)-dependent dehydrogenase (short-subunit alcohol dehydrogenase family)